MTISSTDNRVSYAGNGSTTAFAVSYPFFAEDELLVIVETDSDGSEDEQTLTTDYTVSGGEGSTGTVTMVTAPASGETLHIIRDTDAVQKTDLVNNSAMDAETLEDALDRRAMREQRIQEHVDRSLRVPETEAALSRLPKAADRRNKVLAFVDDSTAAPELIPKNAAGSGFVEVLTADKTVNIPSDYATLQEAFDAESALHVEQGVQITVNIEAGHNPTAGLLLEHGDYGHFVITSDDATVTLDASFPATDVIKCLNARGPELKALIDANGKGDTSGAGVWLEDRSSMRIDNGSGVQNSAGRGLYVNNSRAYAGGANFDGSAGRALWVTRGSTVHAESFRARNAATGTGGVDNTVLVYASRGSTIALNGADLTNSSATEAVVFATRSRIVAEGVDASNNDALYTARARSTGILSVRDMTVNTGRRVARADEGSIVNAEEVTFSSLTQASSAFWVAQGGTIVVDNTNTDVTESNISGVGRFNDVTPEGVIYHGDVGPAQIQVIAKSDEVVNDSARRDDVELFAALDADATYMVEARLFFTQADATANGWSLDFTLPTGASGFRNSGTDGDFQAGGTVSASTAGALTSAAAATSSDTSTRFVAISGLVTMGGTAGNLQLRWGQNTSHASDSTRLKGSSLRVWRA